MNKRNRKATASRATWQAFYFGPLKIATLFMLLAIVLAVVFQPKANDPSTYWATAMVAVAMVVAGVFLVKGGLRLKQVRKSAIEDRRRIAAGLPLEHEDPDDKEVE